MANRREQTPYELLLFAGTFAPLSRASESPMAIACFRLLTVPPLPPLPDFKVPFSNRRIALSTDLPAALPYFRPELFFLGMIFCFEGLECRTAHEVARP